MTLVVAGVHDERIFVISDTKLTHDLTRENIPFWQGIMKAIIIRPDLVIACAGSLSKAQEAVYGFYRDIPLEVAIEHLLQQHKSAIASGHIVEFLVATMSPQPKIIEIKDNGLMEKASGWIGSEPAFEQFKRERRHAAEKAEAEGAGHYPAIAAMDAMTAIAQDDRIEEVGGLISHVGSSKDGFRYYERAALFGGYGVQSIPSGVPTPIRWGTTAEGAFGYDFCGLDDQSGATSYMPHGRMGFLWHSRNRNEFPRTQVIKGNRDEFLAQVLAQTGVPGFCMLS